MNRMVLATGAWTLAAVASSASACLTPPPPEDPPWPGWTLTKENSPLGPGWVRQNLYMNIGIFDTGGNPTPTNCACGIGISGAADWLSNGLIQANAVSVVEWIGDCQTGSPGTPYIPFTGTMGYSPIVSDSLASHFGGAGTGWFGFSGTVLPNSPPLGQNWAICFSFDVSVLIDAALKNGPKGVLVAGIADSNFLPVYVGDHAVVEINSAPIPAPGAFAMLALAGLVGTRRRRR